MCRHLGHNANARQGRAGRSSLNLAVCILADIHILTLNSCIKRAARYGSFCGYGIGGFLHPIQPWFCIQPYRNFDVRTGCDSRPYFRSDCPYLDCIPGWTCCSHASGAFHWTLFLYWQNRLGHLSFSGRIRREKIQRSKSVSGHAGCACALAMLCLTLNLFEA